MGEVELLELSTGSEFFLERGRKEEGSRERRCKRDRGIGDEGEQGLALSLVFSRSTRQSETRAGARRSRSSSSSSSRRSRSGGDEEVFRRGGIKMEGFPAAALFCARKAIDRKSGYASQNKNAGLPGSFLRFKLLTELLTECSLMLE